MAKLSDYLTTDQAAERLKVTTGRVRQMTGTGLNCRSKVKLAGAIRVSGAILIPRKSVEAMAKTKRIIGRPKKIFHA